MIEKNGAMKLIRQSLLIIFITALPFMGSAVSLPAPQGFVNDFANIIVDEDEAVLEQSLVKFQQVIGHEIAVVTVTDLQDTDIELFAVELFQQWGIGKKGEDNGVLLLIAPNERRMRIEVGYGLEPYITDSEASRIIRDVLTPAFRKGDFSGGIAQTVALLQEQARDLSVELPSDSQKKSGLLDAYFNALGIWGVVLPFFVLEWFVTVLSRSKSWWLGGVIGAGTGGLLALTIGTLLAAIVAIPVAGAGGLLLGFFVSKNYQAARAAGRHPAWWAGGGGRHRGWGGDRGGFGGGGFGGGGSGGGGSSGGW